MCTKNKLIRARKVIINESSSLEEKDLAYSCIDKWRDLHEEPLNRVYNSIKRLFKKEKYNVLFSSKRLKRLISIVNKVKRNPSMDISRIQDIGGMRFIFDSLEDVYRAKESLLNCKSRVFSIEEDKIEKFDYIKNPKIDGYRSLHLKLKVHSNDEKQSKLSLELQLRTKLQHYVATTVETLGIIDSVNYKGGNGGSDKREFLKLVSDLFANNEKDHQKFYPSIKVDMEAIKDLGEKYNIISSLASLEPLNSKQKGKYFIFTLTKDHSEIVPFQDKNIADLYYSTLEKSIDDTVEIFKVTVDSVTELKKAYPNWFLNTKDFISSYKKFIK